MMKSLAPASLLMTVLAALTACSTAQPGVTNTFGNVTTPVTADADTVASAAQAVLGDLDLVRIVRTDADKGYRVFGYTTTTDKKVTVKVTDQGDGTSEMSVRVGTAGDEDLSLAIIAKVQSKLAAPEAAPEAPPEVTPEVTPARPGVAGIPSPEASPAIENTSSSPTGIAPQAPAPESEAPKSDRPDNHTTGSDLAPADESAAGGDPEDTAPAQP